MKKSSPTAPGGGLDTQVQAMFQQAIGLHQNGLVEQAAVLYQDILRFRPTHVDALQPPRFGGISDDLGDTLNFGFRGLPALILAGISPVPVA